MDSGLKKGLDFIEDVTRRAAEVQEQVLISILKQNAHTEYLKRHGLDGRTDKSSFKKCLPMVTYEDLQLDIERIANGDLSPILCGRPISEFLTSSGTSAGQRKLMPTISDELERKCFLYSLLMPVMNKYMPGLEKGKGMYLHFIKSESVTPGGLLARPVLTSYYKSTYYIDRPHDPFNCYTSPNETVLCPNSHESMYCQLLCGLIQRSEVLRMGAVFASGFLRALRFLQQHWMDMCEDIKVGKVAKVSDAPAREAVMRLLTAPDPVLAESIAQECSKASWQGIIKRLWPNTKYIDVIVTGTMAQYISALDYYSGGLPLVCTMYASSECYFGLNLRPLDPPSQVSYTLLPNMCYYEFLSVEHAKDDMCSKWLSEQLVELVDVKVGHEYELVVTTYSGLCRYRVGDVLRVTGFHNAAPQFAFVCRKNVVLSIDSDKTGEEDLHVAVQNASRLLQVHGATLVDYTSFADTSSIPGHYVLFWEIERPQSWNMMLSCTLLEDCCLAVEEALDSVYRQGRASDKSIGPLEIRVVARGSFDHLMDYALTSGGASINQYKTPRCVTFAPILELLNSRVTQRSFSTRCPHWSPSYHRQHKPSPLLLHHRQLSPATSPAVSPFAAMKCSNAMQV